MRPAHYLKNMVRVSPARHLPAIALAQARPPAKRSEADGRGGRAGSVTGLWHETMGTKGLLEERLYF